MPPRERAWQRSSRGPTLGPAPWPGRRRDPPERRSPGRPEETE